MPIERLLQADPPPFALLSRHTPGRDPNLVEVLTGPVTEVSRLGEIPEGSLGALAMVPFRQITERGFAAREDGTPLAVLLPDVRHELPLDQALDRLPSHQVEVRDGSFDVADGAYEELVRQVVEREIGTGEGANFVVRREFRGVVEGYTPRDALALFRGLLATERGAYWTFVVHTGERTLVGASPEAHVRMSGGTVVMNPISGTYRYPAAGGTVDGLLDFLADGKEREELSMVVDEELKMMCTVGDQGGVVVGPRLKEMAHLAHTEYELRGRSTLDVRDVLRETMFAATVTGSPVENACRVIQRYERGGRGYYSGALALLDRDEGGAQTLDSPILIRTADIDSATGQLRVGVGATLVRDSDPASEVAETHAKAAGVLSALGVHSGGRASDGERPAPVRLARDPRVQQALDSRRAQLAPFWLQMQTGQHREPAASLSGEVLVIDGEDTFTAMLGHLLRATGLTVTVLRYDEPGLLDVALSHRGPIVLGPGPGDPRESADPKMRLLREVTAELLSSHHGGLLGVCLGHELIAAELGLELVRKERPYQGAQLEIDFFGRQETVGFYNSFTARCDSQVETELALHRVELSRDLANGEIHALRGPGFAGVQFHPESVLTLDGPTIVAGLLAAVLTR